MSTQPHIVLKHRGRRAMHNRAPIVATVTGFWGERSYFGATDEYAHPRVEFSTAGAYDHIDVVFQRHRCDDSDITVSSRSQPSGFMQQPGRWSYSYGARFEARSCEYQSHRRWIRRVLDLLDRANEVRAVGKHHGDDLLTLIVQLRKIGVEVHIFNDAITARRAAHPRRREHCGTCGSSPAVCEALRNDPSSHAGRAHGVVS
jgi:hypothetical protein